MSDNKTPIGLAIEVLNSRIKELEGNVKETGRRSSIATRVAEIKRTIQTLKSHLALEEEAIKEFGKENQCNHDNSDIRHVRCTTCTDCGELIEFDV